jgi:CheY-like chemotaxis protein
MGSADDSVHPSDRGDAGSTRRQKPVLLDVVYKPSAMPDTGMAAIQTQKSMVVAISANGFEICSAIPYPLGYRLDCTLSLPGHPQPIHAIATVVKMYKLEDVREYRLSLEFETFGDEDRAALEMLISQPMAMQGSRAKKLLVVEDDPQLQMALRVRLEAAGYDVTTAADGLEALRKSREERPHLIIMDLMLPQRSGYEVCRLLKFDPQFAGIPIILCTARSRKEDLDLAMAVGANAYVIKPFDSQAILGKVEELLNLNREEPP